MIAERQKAFNTGVGVTLGIVGTILFLSAAWIVSHPKPPIPAPTIGAPLLDKESCRIALTRAGYFAVVQKEEILVQEASLDDPQNQLIKASFAIAACKPMTLKEFCMGTECEKMGVSFTLTGGAPSEDKKVVEPAKKTAPSAKK